MHNAHGVPATARCPHYEHAHKTLYDTPITQYGFSANVPSDTNPRAPLLTKYRAPQKPLFQLNLSEHGDRLLEIAVA